MPLLHRKPFTRTPLPADLDPTERLFYCRVTNEVFRDYDEFFERTILCNSLVWSCSFTGKSGLTFQEALESEKKVKKSLQNFPESLAVPVLYLSTLASHQKLSDLCDDVYEYVKGRFFVGETVTVVRNSGARLECTVLEIKAPPQQNGMVNGNNVSVNVDNDTIVISDSEDDEPTVPDSWKKIEPIDPTLFKYKVKPVVEAMYESVTVRQCQVSRKSSIFSKDRLKFFFKLHCEIQNGFVKAKASTISKYQILEKNYFRYFPDEPPRFEPSADRKPVPRENGLTPRQSLLAAAKERERIEQHRRELRAMDLERERLRRVRADRISRARERRDQINQKEEFKKIVEVERLKKREQRESIKLERDKEREKIREEKRKYAERLKMWNKRREDMECEDLEELPAATPVKTRLPPECFGDALMVSEFLHAFGDLFDLKDEFPEGMTFDMLEDALVGSDPEGPLCELLFFFLSAIFQAMCEEEEEAAKDHITETEARRLKEALGEGTDSTNYALFAVASLAAAWPQLNHGCSLKELNLDSCTLSEILRLHILSSGADSNSASAKYRYQKQGGFVATDDACMELRLNHPAILKKLTTTSVYSLSPDEKLKILHALCGKLLTLVSTREYIEDSVEELRQAKQEFRELKAGQNRKEREEAAARIRKRKEEKLKEQELKIKDKEDQLRDDNVPKAAGNEEQENLQTGNENKDTEQKEQDAAAEDEEMPPPSKKRRGMRSQNGSKENRNQEMDPVDEEKRNNERREQELIDKIQQVTSCTNITPLGRDRWYRRFWTFFSIPGLFVEEDYSGITEDMLQPRPASLREPETKHIVNGHDDSVEAIKEESEASKPVNKANRWCYYSSVEQLEQLIGSLNTRGYRESTLKEVLVQEKSKICQKLNNFPAECFNVSENPPSSEETKPGRGRSLNALGSTPISGEKQLELRLCELLLDIEDRIYQGSLGTVKVPDRQLWRAALENCSYELLDDDPKDKSLKVEDNDVEEMEVDGSQSIKDGLQGVKNEESSVPSTNASTPQPVATSLQYLARALLQIEQGVERKYLKAPLGDADDTKNSKSDKKKKEERKKKEDDQTSEKDDTNESGRIPRTVLDRWRESLQSSGNLSQIFLHLSTLDRSILWSRSILNFRCKVCRKKGDSESMILCEGCERVHHIYCVRPKLKFIPDGDWFCGVCRPRRRGRKPGPRPRPPVDDDVEKEDFAEEDALQRDFEKEEEEEEETIVCEEESTKKKTKAKVQLPLKIKGGKSPGKPGPKKKPGKSPKSQQGTPKTTPPASKGRGRKVHSAPPQEKKGGARHSVNTPQPSAEGHETSLVELVSSAPGIGRGRGRGKKIKSVDNTPEFSPFAFRPFTLENLKQIPIGQEEQFENFTPTRKGRGRGKRRLSEISTRDQGNRRSSGRHQGVHELSACEQLVVDLVRHDDSWPFMRLVSKAQVPDYFDVIQKPIALNIIREKVNKCEYSSATEFIEDVQLMFSNCFEYNQPASNEANAALRLQSFFVNEAQKLGLEVPISKPIIPPEPTKTSHI